ncbi:MAG TPA: DUF1707 domain-containing protein [Nocardioidaceae bacterium]|nr:DUF1707 domain-containing protein [Nocardioidaceae bacterium]
MSSQNLRIGDTERDAAVTALGEHFAAGRIDKDEYDERTSVAWGAKTAADLEPLFADLPTLRDASTQSDPSRQRRSARANTAFASRPSLGWFRVARLVLVPLVVVLAVLSLIPWFIVGIAIWFAWMGLARCAWGPRRRW